MKPIAPTLLAWALVAIALNPAQAAPVRIAAFGDSATRGYLVPRKDAYPAQLQRALRARGHDVAVDNQGVNGDTTRGALRRFDEAIAPGTDIAIVEFGTNDRRRGVPMNTVRARLAEIVRSLRARHVQVMLVGLGRLDFSALAKAQGAAYAQFRLPPGQYRARDGAHFNAQGYAILVRRMLPAVEALIARVRPR
jgi:acyl-CoA thioesterase-1